MSDLERLVANSSVEGRDHLLTFIKLSAILTDFSHYFARQNQKPSTLLVFSRLAPHNVKLLNNRLHQWYSEFWRVEANRISCESSKEKMIVNFLKKENQFFLDNLQY